MMRLVYCYIIILLSSCLAFCQKDINYSNRLLIKELTKNSLSLEDLHEINDGLFAAENQPDLQGKYYTVNRISVESQISYIYVGRVNSCRTGGCSSSNSVSSDLSHEFFDYFIFFNSKGEIIKAKVFNYQATHGQEITANSWLKQFSGFDGASNLKVGKNIDAISGATVSVYAITNDIRIRTTNLLNYMSNSRI